MAPDEHTMWDERARTGKNADEIEKSYAQLLQAAKRVDPLTLAEAADGIYKGDGVPRVQVAFLHSWLVLDLLPYRVRGGHPEIDTLPIKVLLLQHLLASAENVGTAVRVMGTWIDCRSLQHGAVLGAHFARSTAEILNRFFKLSREEQLLRVFRWGGKPLDLGDAAYGFKFFPRLPVAFVHWFGDEEFAPFSKILYDISASNYMPTHGLVALTEFLLYRLIEDQLT